MRLSRHRDPQSSVSERIPVALATDAWWDDAGSAVSDPDGKDWTEPADPVPDPQRLLVIVLSGLSLALCNCTRFDISVAVLEMSREYRWRQTTVGIVQSSFFWGYILTQLPAGYYADRFGGKQVLFCGVAISASMTLLTPLAAESGIAALLLVRAVLGAGQGATLPAINSVVARCVRDHERARAVSAIHSGTYIGSVFGLLLAPPLLTRFGWPAVFYCFGALTAMWCVLWQVLVDEPDHLSTDGKDSLDDGFMELQSVPWGKLLSSSATWAIIIAHFCFAWGYFVLFTWLPSYLHATLGFDLTASGFLAVAPWLAMFVVSNIGGAIADRLIEGGMNVEIVRKLMQTIGFMGPAISLAFLLTVSKPGIAVVIMTVALALSSFSHSGVYSNHTDIGPKYSGILLGISNTGAAVPGILGVLLTGYILDKTKSWTVIFGIAIGFYVFGTLAYSALGSGERVF